MYTVCYKQETVKVLPSVKSGRDIRARIFGVAGNVNTESTALLNHFVDFLDKALQINPEKRLNVKEALSHPFITGKI
jgi:serine/threonine-protein kinase PRP4